MPPKRRQEPDPRQQQDLSARDQFIETLGLWGTPRDAEFDRIACVAVEIFRVRIAAITILHRGERWYKSYVGPLDPEPYRVFPFCAFAIRSPQPFIVQNALTDPRLAGHPLLASTSILSYVGAPLVSPEGHAIGTLCVMDPRPHALREDGVPSLVALAAETWSLIEDRRRSGASTPWPLT